jgi:integrase
MMLKAMREIGKPKAWRPNEALRHCSGTRTAERLLRDRNGETDATRMVMSIMGHTSAATSRRRVQLAVEVLRDALK